jgi:hypothetical protein
MPELQRGIRGFTFEADDRQLRRKTAGENS